MPEASVTNATPGPTLFNKRLKPEAVALLAQLYNLEWLRGSLFVARLCDDHLDPSGALLGDVRTIAASGRNDQNPTTT